MTLIDVQYEGHNQEFVKNDSQKLLRECTRNEDDDSHS